MSAHRKHGYIVYRFPVYTLSRPTGYRDEVEDVLVNVPMSVIEAYLEKLDAENPAGDPKGAALVDEILREVDAAHALSESRGAEKSFLEGHWLVTKDTPDAS
jgi:hypothetical protein